MKKGIKKLGLLLLLVFLVSVVAGCATGTNTETNLPSENHKEAEDSKESEGYQDSNVTKEVEASKTVDNVRDGGVIELSALMTMDEIINKIRDVYTLEMLQEGGYFNYSTKLAYPGIEFYFYHDEPMVASTSRPSYIYIESDRYRYNFDIPIGITALKAIEHCEKRFKNAWDWHNNVDIVDQFDYIEKLEDGTLVETYFRLRFQYNTSDYHLSKNDIKSGTKVVGIDLFVPID